MDIISKDLQEEIATAQNRLKNAIRDHQMCVGRLKNDPNNANILDGIRDIQLHIINLGRWQNKLIQRLRTEVDVYQAANPVKGARLALTSLLGLTNNNHITRNKESTTTRRHSNNDQSRPLLNGHAESRRSSKEDYEEVVRNGDVASPLRQDHSVKDRRSSSVEPASPEEDVLLDAKPVKLEENGEEKPKLKVEEQRCFLESLGLITNDRLIEVQKKRSERKRRSTASSHYLYKNWEMPTKRRRHAYLQSLGSAPQTRQTTARLNGPSPPPKPYNKPGPKPGAAAAARSLIAASNKPAPKPAILRNGEGTSKDYFGGKMVARESEKNSGGSSSSSSSSNGRDTEQKKVSQQTTGKAVHIPGLPSGLPSGLTIERIENDSSVCIACRNPGTLTVCEYCSAKFHVSCHTTSPGSTSYCPKCAARFRTDLEILLETNSINKDKETAAAAYTPRAFRSTDEGTEVYKAPGGFYKIDPAPKGRPKLLTAAALGLNQLPSSTFLIPIAATSSANNDSGGIVSVAAIDQSLVVSSSPSFLGSATAGPRLEFAIEQQKQTSILLNQLSQPSIATANGKGESSILRQSQDIVAGQSLLLVDKVARKPVGKRRWSADRSSIKSKPGVSVLDYKWSNRSSTDTESKSKSGFPVTESSNYVTVEVICQDEDERSKTRSENSPGYVYIELEPPEPKSHQQSQESEVFNVPSGNSELRAIDESEYLETVFKSPSSTESVSTDDRDQQQQEDNTSDDNSTNNSITSCLNDSDSFLNTIFPGRYGYKIDVVDLDTSSSELDESLENSAIEPQITSQLESQNEQSEHVKLEEAHLSAPPRTELEEKLKETMRFTEKTLKQMEKMAKETPIEESTIEGTQVEKTVVEATPVEITSVEEQTPVEEVVIQESSPGETSIEEVIVMETSAEENFLITVPDNKSDDVDKVFVENDQISDQEGEEYVSEAVINDAMLVEDITPTIAMMVD